jgi:rhodanese-related sulfurtransferase
MKHLKPREAHDFLQRNPEAVLVDCRSEIEFLFVGHPSGAHHVAWEQT